MKNRVFKVIALVLIVSFSFAFFGCGTASNWATQKNDTKMNELILFESNGSEKYIVFAALDEDGALITAGSSSVAAAYAIVGYTGLVSEVIVPDTYNDPSISEGDLPVTKVLAVDPYSDYKCSRNGSPYTGEDARLQNNTIITSIVFGSDVTYVGAGVCAGMTNLYSVRFEHAEDEVSIGNSAFALCPLDYINYGNIIYLGTFPQSRVTDSSLRSALTLAAGALPSNGNDQNWTSYKYYIGGSNSTDFMWFIDVSYGKENTGEYILQIICLSIQRIPAQHRPAIKMKTVIPSETYIGSNLSLSSGVCFARRTEISFYYPSWRSTAMLIIRRGVPER